MAGEAEIERMIVRLIGDASQYYKTLDTATAKTKSFATDAGMQLKKIGDGMKRLGRQMTMRLTLPIIGVGAGSLKVFSDFDQAMTESLSIMKATDEQAQQMRSLALELPFSGKVIQAPKDLAQAYFFLASAGLSVEQQLKALKPMADFSTAGAFDMARATDILTDALSGLGLASKDAAEYEKNMMFVSDHLSKANQSANASIEQFGKALTNGAAPATKKISGELKTTIALLEVLADTGFAKGESAGTDFQTTINGLEQSYAMHKKEYERLGISLFNSSGQWLDLVDIVDNFNNALGQLSPEMRAVEMQNMAINRSTKNVMTIWMQNIEHAKELKKAHEDVAGATKEIADKQLKSFSNQMKVLWNQVKVVAIELGEVLAPVVIWLNEKLQVAIGWWRGLSDSIKMNTAIVLAVVAAMGPLFIVLGSIISTLGSLALALPLMGTAFSAILPFLPIVAAGVAAVAAAVAWMVYNWKHVLPLWESLKNFWSNAMLPLIKELWKELKQVWQLFVDIGLVAFVSNGIKGLILLASYLLDAVTKMVEGMLWLKGLVVGSEAGIKRVTKGGKYDVYEPDKPGSNPYLNSMKSKYDVYAPDITGSNPYMDSMKSEYDVYAPDKPDSNPYLDSMKGKGEYDVYKWIDDAKTEAEFAAKHGWKGQPNWGPTQLPPPPKMTGLANGFAALQDITASRSGTADAASLIANNMLAMSSRNTGKEESTGERTANATEGILGVVTRIADEGGSLSPANLASGGS